MGVLPMERCCAICGSKFLGADQWVFKRNRHWFCSWGCLREYEKGKTVKRNNNRLTRMDREKVIQMLQIGLSPKHVAEKMGLTINAVVYYQTKLRG